MDIKFKAHLVPLMFKQTGPLTLKSFSPLLKEIFRMLQLPFKNGRSSMEFHDLNVTVDVYSEQLERFAKAVNSFYLY